MVAKASFLNGDQAGRVFEVKPDQIATFQGAQRRLAADFGGAVRLDSASEAATQLTITSGEQLRLGLTWTVTAPAQSNYSAFVHLVDPDGKVVAQDDRQGLPAGGWRPGTRFLSLHELRLPANVGPGAYRLMAGLERRTTGQPSQSLGELGPQVQVLSLQAPP
jgi:hypothetical protein